MRYDKFVIVGIISIFGSFNLANASELDDSLIKFGAIDSNYKFTDIEKAEIYFRAFNKGLQKYLPVKIDSDTTLVEIEASPYVTAYKYRMIVPDGFDLSEISMVLDTDFMKQYYCETLFVDKYQKANDTIVDLNWHDSNGTLVDTLTLNNQTCD